MKRNTGPLLLTTATTLLSGVVALYAYRALEHESARATPFASFARGTTAYIIRDTTDPGRCVGGGHVVLDYSNNQVTLNVDGWASMRFHNNSAPLSLRGAASFNSLGQLTAMVFHTGFGAAKFKVGSTQINPIKLEVYRDTPESPLVFRQFLPGPVTLKPTGELFELAAPFLSTHQKRDEQPGSPLRVEITNVETPCDAATAGSFDLSPVLRTAEDLARTIQNKFGGE